jgi:hypothetical protein
MSIVRTASSSTVSGYRRCTAERPADKVFSDLDRVALVLHPRRRAPGITFRRDVNHLVWPSLDSIGDMDRLRQGAMSILSGRIRAIRAHGITHRARRL